ncbi:hypothetical protein DASC09_020630 [Saccharomycopsis crataegensis]|uniref:AMP-dependent synthetase/ligase domain-containing protein n=1 Tax=Saccharomycopsis crataegensis TaxID=43959 RepID=A0AAV5QKQ5_9ASCO|nr:hypothetical protein DASC09_020630 [Saccharomycopsis crataegensis]
MGYPIVYPSLVKEGETYEQTVAHFPYRDDQLDKAVPLPNSQKPGFSPVFRNNVSKDGLFSGLHKDANTIYEAFQHVLTHQGDNDFLGRREVLESGKLGGYKYETYKQIGAKRDCVGSGILKCIEKYPEVDADNFIVSLYSGNTYEWMLTDLASHAFKFANTTLYDSLGKESSAYILSLTESPVIVLSKANITKVLGLEDLSHLKVMISMDEFKDDKEQATLVQQAEARGIELLSFEQLVELGAKYPAEHRPPTRDDLLTISFTSGTSGMPKGVELSHEAFISGVVFCFCHVNFPENVCSFCFLPLAHVLERFKVAFEICVGARIALPHNPSDVRTFLDDIKELGISSHLCTVPRVYSKIEQGLRSRFASLTGIQGMLVRNVIAFKGWYDYSWGANGKGLLNKVIDKVFLSKIRSQLGFAQLDFLISGGAPINASAIEFLRSAFGCGFYSGYGLSETFAAVCLSSKYETNLRCVGPVGVTCELRLRDVPDLDYTWDANRSGEVMFRGPQVFTKYFKDEQKTKDAFDEEGWFYTGDVGRLDKDGKLEVIDRVKNFFKLSQGEYIAVEKIENIYLSNCEFMEQIFIYGDSLEDHLVGIVGVTPESVLKYAKSCNGADVPELGSADEVVKKLESNDVELRTWLLKESQKNIAKSGLFGFEKFKNAYFSVDPLTIENNCMTPTMKLKRPIAKKVYQAEIRQLYAEGNL